MSRGSKSHFFRKANGGNREKIRIKHILSFLEKVEKEEYILAHFYQKNVRNEADRSARDLSKNVV